MVLAMAITFALEKGTYILMIRTIKVGCIAEHQ